MNKVSARILSAIGLTTLLLFTAAPPATSQPTWQPLANAPGVFLDTCLLLTDGTVMCHRYNSAEWRRLTPDNLGSYQNGTWSTMPSMPNGSDTTAACSVVGGCPYRPLYFASAVLPSGNVVVIGGEYNNLVATWTNIGFMFNPVTNAWSSQIIEAFGRPHIGDAQAVVLPDGTMLLANIDNGNIEAFDPITRTFTPLNPMGKLAGDKNNEENWNILPDGRVLTVNAWVASSFELYDRATNTWSSGTMPVNLADCCGAANGVGNSKEVGPGVLRPDGTLIYFSGNRTGQNAVYDTLTNTWTHTAAMDFPAVSGQTYHYAVPDGPASLLPNGNVLVMASPASNTSPFNTPSQFFEFDGTNLTQVVGTPNAASFIAYQGRMLLLPSGEVLLTAYDQAATQDVMLYSNGGAPQDAWRPVITVAPATVAAGGTYSISGTLFNGFSEGASYGDDATMSSNYPLVRITNGGTGHVAYARTHDHSRMGVQVVGSAEVVTTQFDVPAGLEAGPSYLTVVVNGIESLPVVTNRGATTTTVQPATEDYHDAVTLRADITPVGVSGKVEFFVNGSSVGLGAYEASTGIATLSHVIQLASGSYSLRADFTSSTPLYFSSTNTLKDGLTVTKEETTLSYTGPTVIPNGSAATMSGVLLEDGIVPISGRTVTFTLGSGATAQSCSGVTDASGKAACVINPVAQPLGAGVVGDAFAGDTYYEPASNSATTVVFAFLNAGGAFVVGDKSALSGASATFWSSEWSLANSLSGGVAPAAFKGFANSLPAGSPACGISWSSAQGGNSVGAPAAVPSFMGVLVASSVTKTGAVSNGNAVRIVVVQTDAGYGLGPGRRGTGTIVAELCH